MAEATVGTSATAGGYTFTDSATISGDGLVLRDPSIAAAKTGTLSTRSSDTAGTLTMSSGHGFTDGQKIDIYWSTGQCTRATIGTVATNSVPFTGAGGDVLPAQGTAITAMVETVEDFDIDAADLEFLALKAGTAACSATFLDGSSAVVGRVLVSAADGTAGTTQHHYVWHSGSGVDDPISDDAVSVCLSHGSSAAAQTVVCAAVLS